MKGNPVPLPVLLVSLGFALRFVFVLHQPFTNDEGLYLYGAKTLLEGRLPRGDVLTKAPAVAGLFMAAVWASDGSLFAARLASALLNTLTAFPLAALGRRLGGPRAGSAAGLTWLFAAGPIVFAAFGQTEAAAGFFGVSALALAAAVLRVGEEGPTFPRRRFLALAAGVLLALAFASRKTSGVLLLPAALLFWNSPRVFRAKIFTAAFAGALLAIVPWLVLAYWLYGTVGIREALGIGYAAIIAGHLRNPEAVGAWAASPHWALGVGLRTAGPVLLLALLGAGSGFWGGRLREIRTSPLAVPTVWLAALALLYAAWPTLLPDYLPEFFPPVVLLAVAGLLRGKSLLGVSGQRVSAGLLLVWNLGILWSVYHAPWIGMFTANAVRTAAAEVQRYVPRDEPIFTAALLVPYLSGHRTLFDVAHPFWYRYAFISPSVQRTFLPPLEEIESAVRTDVRWALVEQFTDYVYLRHPSNLLAVIWKDFTFVREIPNETGYRVNPLLLWRR
ncbi:MAG: hypothetical protein G01um101438_1033 [Parcubacteria group bacterium Gr01-1014_38]|nr:MAG: hypothetical protein G01um101438_1033 [Parcubacteria group bacterium Gr01-1014_38]